MLNSNSFKQCLGYKIKTLDILKKYKAKKYKIIYLTEEDVQKEFERIMKSNKSHSNISTKKVLKIL